MTSQTMKLAVGGPVQAKYGTYLNRAADNLLLHACQEAMFAYVLSSRQIGKSSLMFETSKKLVQAGIKTVLIDLNSIGSSADADHWYFSLVAELAQKLKLEVDMQHWWESRPRLSTLTQRFLEFLREVVLKKISEPIVIFIDEIDMTLGLDFTDDFFAAIRSVHNDRAQYPAFHQLTFVLLGVATPDELIKDQTRTPFNVGQAIPLYDFTKEECDPFRIEIEGKYPARGRDYFDRVYDWTQGHPYLTQKLVEAILVWPDAETGKDKPDLVDRIVRKLFLAVDIRSEDNLQFVQTRVTGDAHAQEMLKVYKRILDGKAPVQDDEQSPPINRLKLYGLVLAKNGKLRIRNKIYSRAFDLAWADEMLRLNSASVRLGLPSRYKILQEIGQGGFSTVYLAQIQNDSDKTQAVALKVLKTDSVDNINQVKRFKQEARTIARLEHPNIIRILETGTEDETFFIVMEYIGEGTLSDRLKAGPLARAEAIHIVRHIGAALAYAHEHGVIHRDIKPGNILLDTGPEGVRPVLTDFGLIKLLVEDDFTKIHSTAVLGTLDYMAPEQWSKELPTPATDVYALAITFFEMLSGQRPFVAKSPFELMNKHTTEPLPRLSAVVPEAGPFFDDILLKAAAKKPEDRFSRITDFIEALEAANTQAEAQERAEQKNQAAKAVEAAQGYMRGRYDPARALTLIDVALELYPDYLDALRLRGKILLQQNEFEEALQIYDRAYQKTGDPKSEVGAEYLKVLDQVANTLWQNREYEAAVKHYETIRQIIAGQNHDADVAGEVWSVARNRLIEYHHHQGDQAYAWGHPEHMDQAIQTLNQKIRLLDQLAAKDESIDLQEKIKQLQVSQSETMIRTSQAAIDDINAKGSQIRFSNEDIFQHYQTIENAYRILHEIDPDNEQWQEKRRTNLKELAQSRCVFASRALGKLDPDYETALRHYKAVLDIEQTQYPGLVAELGFDLDEKITNVEAKANYDGKYNQILRLIDEGAYSKALERLDQEFIQTGNYEHRDVAKWLWGLIYAKQHEGALPPEWMSLSGFEFLSKRLVQVERRHVQTLKDRIEPWSQGRILKMMDHENKQLGDYEGQLQEIEALLREALNHNVAETPDMELCRTDLAGIRTQIEDQRKVFLQLDVTDTAQKVEAWLQKIEDIEALLQTGNPVEDIPAFLNRIDEEQQLIENDSMFERLRGLVSTNMEIGRSIDQIKRRIRRHLVKILINDVGERDEALTQAHEKIAQTRTELDEIRQTEQAARREIKALETHYKVFSVSLIPALIVGGIIGILIAIIVPDIQNLSWMAPIAAIAMLSWVGWIFLQLRQRW
jgi:tRNA A-37 threonylcarbamoyl transferase component Bud32